MPIEENSGAKKKKVKAKYKALFMKDNQKEVAEIKTSRALDQPRARIDLQYVRASQTAVETKQTTVTIKSKEERQLLEAPPQNADKEPKEKRRAEKRSPVNSMPSRLYMNQAQKETETTVVKKDIVKKKLGKKTENGNKVIYAS